jgi:hypothetical protein
MSSVIFHPKADIGLFEEFRANLKRGYVVLWHIADVQRLPGSGLLTGALPTIGAECRFTAGNQTQFRAAANARS